MTPAQMKKAYRLWKTYKVHGREYRQIADELGIQITQLNQRMHLHNSIQKGK